MLVLYGEWFEGDWISDWIGGVSDGRRTAASLRWVAVRASVAAAVIHTDGAALNVALYTRKRRAGLSQDLSRARLVARPQACERERRTSGATAQIRGTFARLPHPRLARPLPRRGRGERLEQRLKSVEPSQDCPHPRLWRGLSRGAGEANVWSNGSNPWNLRKIALTRAFGAASPAERERRTSRRVG